MKLNENYSRLEQTYLFYHISQRTQAYRAAHPDCRLLLLGIGDVSLPLAPAVIRAMHRAVDEQAAKETFHGYMPELGTNFLKQSVCQYYRRFGVVVDPEEVFITPGAGEDLGAVGDLFDADNTVAVTEPAYPAYVDTNLMAGRRVLHLSSGKADGFLPMPRPGMEADLIYLCSPANPTGAAYTREQLQVWVDYANACQAVIVFDAAYEAFIQDREVPHSIYELPGARQCAIEICSLSKTAGFTGVRCGYTVVPTDLVRNGTTLHTLWVRNRTTKTNGVSYIVQRGAQAALSEEGIRQSRENIRSYLANARLLTTTLEDLGIWYCGGRNSPYVWMECPRGMTSWQFFDLLLNQIQVVGTPGSGFGACGEGFFRFSSFGTPEDTALAASRLRSLLG